MYVHTYIHTNSKLNINDNLGDRVNASGGCEAAVTAEEQELDGRSSRNAESCMLNSKGSRLRRKEWFIGVV